jgi:hypothetical protein
MQSWNKFTILNLNFHSIKNKKAETLNIIDSYNPDIIIDTETWLNDSVHNSEIFPPNYNIYRRRDRRDGFGGVLVAVGSVALVRRFISPKVRWSEGSLVRRSISPKVH